MRKSITVGLGEVRASKEPGDVIVACGLGSCVGVAAYDPSLKAGVLAHVVLPEARGNCGNMRSARYATDAIPLMIEILRKMGCRPSLCIWKIAGGAQVLTPPILSDRLLIGERNIAAVKSMMKQYGLAIQAEDTGGRFGRTMQLHIDSGRVTIRSVGSQQWDL